MPSADSIAQTILGMGRIRGEQFTREADAKARLAQIDANAGMQRAAIWGNTLQSLGQIPGQVMQGMQQQKEQTLQNQTRELQNQRAKQVIDGEQAMAGIWKNLKQNPDGSFDTKDLQSILANPQITTEQRGDFLKTIDAFNSQAQSFTKVRQDHAADLANAALTSAQKSGQPLNVLNAVLWTEGAAKAGIATPEEVQHIKEALVAGADPTQMFQHIRSMGSKYKPDIVTMNPGDTAFDKNTSQPVYTAPTNRAPTEMETALKAAQGDPTAKGAMNFMHPTPQQRPAALGTFEDYVARKYGQAPTPEQIIQARKDYGQADDRPLASQTAPTETPMPTPGTAEYQVAKDLASGNLTFGQFRTLSAYGRDTGKKMAIYALAAQLNPEFNPSQFELGFKMASNPQIRQRVVAINSLGPVIDQIDALAEQVGNGDMPAWNKLLNTAKFQMGNRRVTNFRQLQTLLGDEVGNALGVGTGSDLKTKLGLDLVNPNLSAGNFKATMQQLRDVLDARKQALVQQMGVYGGAAGGNGSQQTPPPTSTPGVPSYQDYLKARGGAK